MRKLEFTNAKTCPRPSFLWALICKYFYPFSGVPTLDPQGCSSSLSEYSREPGGWMFVIHSLSKPQANSFWLPLVTLDLLLESHLTLPRVPHILLIPPPLKSVLTLPLPSIPVATTLVQVCLPSAGTHLLRRLAGDFHIFPLQFLLQCCPNHSYDLPKSRL